MFQPDTLWGWGAWLLGLVTLVAAAASDIKSLEVEDWLWGPALLCGVLFTTWSAITGHLSLLLLAFAILWVAMGAMVFFTGMMGGADGLGIIAVALLEPRAALITITVACVILIVTHTTLDYLINLKRIRRDSSYTAGLKKLNLLTAAFLLAVAVKHPAPFRPEAGTPVYSERTGRFTWFTDADAEEERNPVDGDWVQLALPAIPFLLASYVGVLLAPSPF